MHCQVCCSCSLLLAVPNILPRASMLLQLNCRHVPPRCVHQASPVCCPCHDPSTACRAALHLCRLPPLHHSPLQRTPCLLLRVRRAACTALPPRVAPLLLLSASSNHSWPKSRASCQVGNSDGQQVLALAGTICTGTRVFHTFSSSIHRGPCCLDLSLVSRCDDHSHSLATASPTGDHVLVVLTAE